MTEKNILFINELPCTIPKVLCDLIRLKRTLICMKTLQINLLKTYDL